MRDLVLGFNSDTETHNKSQQSRDIIYIMGNYFACSVSETCSCYWELSCTYYVFKLCSLSVTVDRSHGRQVVIQFAFFGELLNSSLTSPAEHQHTMRTTWRATRFIVHRVWSHISLVQSGSNKSWNFICNSFYPVILPVIHEFLWQNYDIWYFSNLTSLTLIP